ncbi:uncharacterized protein LOC143245645 [Tachypleus tridentatus]|uniref:uncharacterized protein LOC143245645 n=1 Tax=Tachypleus tridentatus TaxID=6853 RepID=UPI003FD4C44B
MEITTNYLLWMNLCFALVALVHRNNTSELYNGKAEDQKPKENVLILERNKRLKEERFSILNGLLSKWKDCLLYQETCTEQGGYEKCDPDLVVVAMAACFSEYEDCDSYLTCSGEVEKTCLFDKEQLRVCEYIHGCSQCNSSSNRECSPRFAVTLKWAMLEEKKKILLAKHDKGTSECRGVKTGLYWMMPQLMNNRRNTDHSETYDQRSTVNENEAGFFNFIVVAVDNRIADWKFDSQERKGSYIKPDDNVLLNVNEIRATAKSQSEYGLARLIVLDECYNIHVICQMVTPSSFKPHLQSRQRKIFYEAHKETVFCVKDNLFLELVDGGPPKFSSVEMSDFENKMMTTPDKTSESSFETVKLNSLENFWLELGNIDQKGNSSGIPGIFIIQTRKGERLSCRATSININARDIRRIYMSVSSLCSDLEVDKVVLVRVELDSTSILSETVQVTSDGRHRF